MTYVNLDSIVPDFDEKWFRSENVSLEIFVIEMGSRAVKNLRNEGGVIKGNGIKNTAKAECNFQLQHWMLQSSGRWRGFMGKI